MVHAEKIRIAVASNFMMVMEQLMLEYEKQSQDTLLVSYGSSGKIFAQISRGAPFDVFLSADQQKPEKLQQMGKVTSDNRFTYAIGSLVLWSRDAEFLIKSQDQTLSLNKTLFEHLDFRKLAIANPRTAPYGQAAQEVLINLSAMQRVKSKLVTGENIAQTFLFVNSGNAQLGFVARAQLLQLSEQNKGSYWNVPVSLHNPIKQDAVLLNNAPLAAKKFFVFLQSEPARNIIISSGYSSEFSTNRKPHSHINSKQQVQTGS